MTRKHTLEYEVCQCGRAWCLSLILHVILLGGIFSHGVGTAKDKKERKASCFLALQVLDRFINRLCVLFSQQRDKDAAAAAITSISSFRDSSCEHRRGW